MVKGDIESVDLNGDKLTITKSSLRIDSSLGNVYNWLRTNALNISSSTNGQQLAEITANPQTSGAYFTSDLPGGILRRGLYENNRIQLDFGDVVERFVVRLGSTSSDNLQVIMRNLPTSPTGLSTGQLYKDTNGFLKVV